MKPTNLEEFLGDLNAGVFADQVADAISRVAAGVVDHGRKGQVRITLDMKRINDGHQIMVSHKLDYNQPNLRGNTKVDTTTETPMYVTSEGVCLFDKTTPQLFDGKQAPVLAVPIAGKKKHN